jgi:hypothetical protein
LNVASILVHRMFYYIYHRFAFFMTAVIHLWWNDLVQDTVKLVIMCLPKSTQTIFQSIIRLHMLTLLSVVLCTCFHVASASSEQGLLGEKGITLDVRFRPAWANKGHTNLIPKHSLTIFQHRTVGET